MFVWVYDDSTHRGFDFCSSVVPSFEFGLLYLYLEIFPYSPFVFHSSRLHSALAGIFLYSARIFSLTFTLYIRSPVHTHTHKRRHREFVYDRRKNLFWKVDWLEYHHHPNNDHAHYSRAVLSIFSYNPPPAEALFGWHFTLVLMRINTVTLRHSLLLCVFL